MKISSMDSQTFDVIVCGGGSAGLAAACGAAQTGTSTLLVERYAFSGGTAVSAMIHTLDGIKSCRDNSCILVGGIAADLVREIEEMGGIATSDNPPEALAVHPEFLKVAADRLLRRFGVHILYFATAVDALMDGNRVRGVEAALKDGRVRFASSIVIDATGDADVVYFSGAPFEIDKDLQALTYHFRLGNVQEGRDWKYLEDACRRAMQAAYRQGLVRRFGGPWLIRLTDDEITVNTTRVFANPIEPSELTRAEMRAREDMLIIVQILRDGVDELQKSYIIAGAMQLHNRESRKVIGEYILTEQDVTSSARFPDSIAAGGWPIDIHPTDGFIGVHPHKENPPEPYEIPFRCLLPLKIENLLVCGRPISTTHRAHGSTRVPGTSMATGQAAGVAAALAAARGCAPRTLDSALVQHVLGEQGAIINVAEHKNP